MAIKLHYANDLIELRLEKYADLKLSKMKATKKLFHPLGDLKLESSERKKVLLLLSFVYKQKFEGMQSPSKLDLVIVFYTHV